MEFGKNCQPNYPPKGFNLTCVYLCIHSNEFVIDLVLCIWFNFYITLIRRRGSSSAWSNCLWERVAWHTMLEVPLQSIGMDIMEGEGGILYWWHGFREGLFVAPSLIFILPRKRFFLSKFLDPKSIFTSH